MRGEDAAPPLSFATRHGPRKVGAVARFTSKRLAGGHDGAEPGRDALGPERDQPPVQRNELVRQRRPLRCAGSRALG